VALDVNGRVYLVGTDNQIYWERGGTGIFGVFFSQPPLACIDKLVVLGSGLYGQYLMVRGCDAQHSVFEFSRATGWLAAGKNSLDITSAGDSPTSGNGAFFVLGSDGSLSQWEAGDSGFLNVLPSSFTTSTWTGSNGPAHSALIGGVVGFSNDYFPSCAGPWTFTMPGILLNLGYGTFVNATAGGLIQAADPGGCANLQLPTEPGAFDSAHSPILRKVTSTNPGEAGGGGPGDDVLWIRTNTSRVYALTRTSSRN
jgi:hypothetical protein